MRRCDRATGRQARSGIAKILYGVEALRVARKNEVAGSDALAPRELREAFAAVSATVVVGV